MDSYIAWTRQPGGVDLKMKSQGHCPRIDILVRWPSAARMANGRKRCGHAVREKQKNAAEQLGDNENDAVLQEQKTELPNGGGGVTGRTQPHKPILTA
jgi:hypothetical protein